VKRVWPLLVAFAIAAIAWQVGWWPVERTITWKLWGEYAKIRRVEVQLYEGDTLLKSEELLFPEGATFDPSSRLHLSRGNYETRVMIWRGADAPEVHSGHLEIDATSTELLVP
jgi:hypothetical protein